MARKVAAALALAVLTASLTPLAPAAPCRAGEAEREFRLTLWQDWGVNGLLIAGWVVPELFKGHLAPDPCRWCDESAGKWDPPGIDRWARDLLVRGNKSAPALASDILAFGILPVASLGVDLLSRNGDWRGSLNDATLIVQGIAASAAANQLVKFTAGRQRPYAHADPRPFAEDPDQNVSFYSGHTALAFSTVVSTGTVMARRNSPYAPWVLGIGLPAAAGVGALRIAADKHYLTDVLTGALVGSGIAFLVVWLHPMEE
jgi:membrane-associated phospholipid phosphatase